MKLAVMQPYLFPHLGYFQLIGAVDAFVVYDDVNFIKGGWINRNYILAASGKQRITLPLQLASSNKLICEINVASQHKILQSLVQNYSKAPHFEAVYPMLEEVFKQPMSNLACFLDYQLRRICDHLDLRPKWHISSALEKNQVLRGQDKILDICDRLGATHYLNTVGGKALYNTEAFAAHGVKLSFIQSKDLSYPQFGQAFMPHLSIIDVLMFNDRKQCAKLIEEYELV